MQLSRRITQARFALAKLIERYLEWKARRQARGLIKAALMYMLLSAAQRLRVEELHEKDRELLVTAFCESLKVRANSDRFVDNPIRYVNLFLTNQCL